MKRDVSDLRFEYYTQDWTGSHKFILDDIVERKDALAIAFIKVKKIGADLKHHMKVKEVVEAH